MKDSKWVIVMLLLSVVSITVQNYLLRTDISRSREAYKKDLDDVYFLMKSDSSKLYTIMDTEIRILHYARPHKEPMWCCPECAEQKKRSDLDEPIQGVHRHKQGKG